MVDTSVSMDLLNRNDSTQMENSSVYEPASELLDGRKAVILRARTVNIKTVQSTLQILTMKEGANSSAVIWVSADGMKILTEEQGTFQEIIFWGTDFFSEFHFVEENLRGEDIEHEGKLTLKISLLDMRTFFESIKDEATIDFMYMCNNPKLMIEAIASTSRSRILIPTISNNVHTSVFNFDTGVNSTVLMFKTTDKSTLDPTFRTLEKDKQNITIETSPGKGRTNFNIMVISSRSQAETVETQYSKESFDEYECYKKFTAKYKMSVFFDLKKAWEKSTYMHLMINNDNLLYAEFGYEVDKETLTNIAFYIAAQND